MFRIAQMGITSLEIWGSGTVLLIELGGGGGGGSKYCTHWEGGGSIDWHYIGMMSYRGCGRVRVNQSTQHVDAFHNDVKFSTKKSPSYNIYVVVCHYDIPNVF